MPTPNRADFYQLDYKSWQRSVNSTQAQMTTVGCDCPTFLELNIPNINLYVYSEIRLNRDRDHCDLAF